MLCTISMGSCILVQGLFVRQLANGKTVVRIGKEFFEGKPVSAPQAA